ncbi:MAG: HAD-IIB family hydrolase [Candidatus Methanomethyliaceae archaeon]|nr:HAD-IIB family hydrolase [Candidatus Methanomethyliaceae archaeon]MDW7970862.1 HAD-IIB family hydrolase [Nitrososphaerota archaeon]
MKVEIIVMDYDRTIADEENNFMINSELKILLENLPQKKILATGRALENIPDKIVFEIFDALVLENGTIIMMNGNKEVLPDKKWYNIKDLIIERAKKENIDLMYGEIIIFGSMKYYEAVVELLKKNGMLKEIHFDFNRNIFIILPKDWNKGRGVKIAIERLGNGRIMAIGDDINDIPLFEIADIKVAVGNAITELKRRADIICEEKNGRGVLQILKKLR